MKPRSNKVFAKQKLVLRKAVGILSNQFLKHRVLALLVVLLTVLSFFAAVSQRPSLRIGSSKYVIILGANKGGGVLQWKSAKEWDLEKTSIENKKAYASRHGYHLAIKDMTAKRRYTHEWRESWEKVDIIRQTMRQFPNAEWFWWIDLESYIMEPQVALEEHIFNHLDKLYRNCSYYNPLNVDLDMQYLDDSQPIDLIISQDCGGFSLGSFFIRRSEWTELLLDVWWDPIFYEQKHMEWVHGEQQALEYLYRSQPWIRSRTGFGELRLFNAYPIGACSDKADDSRFFYNRHDRDFVVNMAGCHFGRDCWKEIEDFKALSNELHKKRYRFF